LIINSVGKLVLGEFLEEIVSIMLM